jgi:hypothetical protein
VTSFLAAEQMAYKSRALAQSEPFTQLARDVLDKSMTAEREAQPGNFSVWANAAFTKGYCVRRVEEDDAALDYVTTPPESMPPRETVLATTDAIVTLLRSEEGELGEHAIADQDRLFEVLDRVIGSEVSVRTDNAGPTLSSRARIELEDYLTFWVVKGYALRAAEAATGAITPA